MGTFLNRPGLAAGHRFRIAAVAALAIPGTVGAQTPAGWATLADKETLITVLMPPGASFTTNRTDDPKSGDRILVSEATVQDDKAGYFYLVESFRANKTAMDHLKATQPKNAEPLLGIINDSMAPLITKVQKAAKEHPKQASFTRKPIVWSGMKGEDITIRDNADGKDRFGTLRVVRSERGFVILFGGETKATPEHAARLKKFIQSLGVSTDDPFDSAPPMSTTPATPTTPAPAPGTPATPTTPAPPPGTPATPTTPAPPPGTPATPTANP